MTCPSGTFEIGTFADTAAECWEKLLLARGAFTAKREVKRNLQKFGWLPLRIKIVGGVHE
jgi:hypothetical protein